MHIKTGIYQWGKRKIGLKRDFCNACEQPCIAGLWRSFECWHLGWIPLLPLGWRWRWKCERCEKNPRTPFEGRAAYIALGLFFVALAVACFFIDLRPDEVLKVYSSAVVCALLGIAIICVAWKRKSIDKKAMRSAIIPLNEHDSCPICNKPLVADPYLHCANCKLLIY